MTEREQNRLASRLEFMARDIRNHLAWIEDALTRMGARVPERSSAGAGGENGAKESKERDIPPTPPIEKETKENLRSDRLIDTAKPAASASGNQSIDPLIVISESDVREIQSGGLEPSEAEVASVAATALGVPSWYAKWWHRYMSAADWTTNRGERVNRKNWRPLLMTWWRNCRDDEREVIRREVTDSSRPRESPEAMRKRLLAEQEVLFGKAE